MSSISVADSRPESIDDDNAVDQPPSSAENPPISTIPLKTQLVYIQTPSNFAPKPIPPPPNMLVNAVQFGNRPNSGVILGSVHKFAKKQQIMIAKQGAYVTMLKPLPPNDSDESQKFVIAPMPKVIKNARLPVTMTTNSLKPKIAIVPFGSEPMQAPVEKNENEYELSIVEDCSNSLAINATKSGDANGKKKDFVPKYTKHGISILKKNYNPAQNGTVRNGLVSNVCNANHSVLDSENEPTQQQSKSRRRKSNFSYRKDYDDMEIVEENACTDMTVTKISSMMEAEPARNGNGDDYFEMSVIKEKMPDINMNDDCDLKKILSWEHGVGSLPGSSLKFIINEFNMLEYLTKEEHNKMVAQNLSKEAIKPKVKLDVQEDIRCEECGCYGLPSEFRTPKFCSLDCESSARNKEMEGLRKKRKKSTQNTTTCQSSPISPNLPLAHSFSFQAFSERKKDFDSTKLENSSEDELNSNDNSQDKYLSPWVCSKKGFSWTKYLEHLKMKAPPVKLFKDPFPYTRNTFRQGMKLEGIDPLHPSYFCVLTVTEVVGYRMRLGFDGYRDIYDFWVNADSLDIFPVGWCEKHGRVLQPPHGYTVNNFNWANYLKHTKANAAPKQLFASRVSNIICPNGFRVGMKLEAVDRTNLNLVCVATVKDMMDNRILVHFDSWDDIYDYWVDPTSPYIHPVGWCDQQGHNLTPPNDYPDLASFSWEKYLKETKSVAAPVRAFKQRPPNGFKIGMRLECVDKRMPRFIRVANVSDVRGHQIRIHFDGWRDIYSYWVDDDSTDIHPIGWCQKTGHSLEPPLTPNDVYDTEQCPTAGCHGIGHANALKGSTHSERRDCPYADENLGDKGPPDRMLSPDRLVEAVVPVSREPKDKPYKARLGRPPKFPKQESTPPILMKNEEESTQKKPKRKYRKRLKVETDLMEPKAKLLKKVSSFLDDAKIEPAMKEAWPRHSEYLNGFVVGVDDSPMRWSDHRVASFVGRIPGCGEHAFKFRAYEIDGEAFLSLSQRDLIELLRIKVGHAVKLYNVIVLLRRKFREECISPNSSSAYS